MSAQDEILSERLCVTNTLDTGIHKASIAQVAQAGGTLFGRNCKGREAGNKRGHDAAQDKQRKSNDRKGKPGNCEHAPWGLTRHMTHEVN